MRILVINNDGAGFADYLEVEPNTSVDKLFAQQMSGRKPEDYLIRVNRQPVARDQVLQEGDRVSMTPTKIQARESRRDSRRLNCLSTARGAWPQQRSGAPCLFEKENTHHE